MPSLCRLWAAFVRCLCGLISVFVRSLCGVCATLVQLWRGVCACLVHFSAILVRLRCGISQTPHIHTAQIPQIRHAIFNSGDSFPLSRLHSFNTSLGAYFPLVFSSLTLFASQTAPQFFLHMHFHLNCFTCRERSTFRLCIFVTIYPSIRSLSRRCHNTTHVTTVRAKKRALINTNGNDTLFSMIYHAAMSKKT